MSARSIKQRILRVRIFLGKGSLARIHKWGIRIAINCQVMVLIISRSRGSYLEVIMMMIVD